MLIYFIQQGEISWIESSVLITIYILYVMYLFKTMSGGDNINYEEPFTDKEKVSFLSAFIILDLKRIIIGNKKLNTNKAWLIFVFSSLVIGFVCYFLVIACEGLVVKPTRSSTKSLTALEFLYYLLLWFLPQLEVVFLIQLFLLKTHKMEIMMMLFPMHTEVIFLISV